MLVSMYYASNFHTKYFFMYSSFFTSVCHRVHFERLDWLISYSYNIFVLPRRWFITTLKNNQHIREVLPVHSFTILILR